MNQNATTKIEVLVLTYNRAHLIASTLESLLAQRLSPSRICVLDNGSTDNTVEIVRSFQMRGIELLMRKTNDPRACWTDLQSIAQGPWTMLFHDDDLLHPEYLQHAGSAIAKHRDITVVVSGMRVYANPERVEWSKVCEENHQKLTARQLATSLYAGFPMPFCSTIYRTDVLKQTKIQFTKFGKIFDRPFVLDVAQGGALLFLDPYVKYRTHALQDSTDQTSGPSIPQVFALQNFYRQLIGENIFTKRGRIFLRRNYRNLISDHKRLMRGAMVPIDSNEFLHKAIEAGAASGWSLNVGMCYAIFTQVPRMIGRVIKDWVRSFVSNSRP